MTTPRTTNTKINEELKQVWSSVNVVQSEVSDIKTTLARLETGFITLVSTVDKITSSQQTPWNIIWTAIGVIIGFVVVMGGGALLPLHLSDNHISNRITEVVNDLEYHKKQPGHIDGIIKVARLEKDVEYLSEKNESMGKKIDYLDINLQREMRDLDQISETRLNNLDTVLQREMQLSNKIQDVQTLAHEKVLEVLKERQIDSEKRILSIESTRYSSNDASRDRVTREDYNERLSKVEALLEALNIELKSKDK